MVFKPYIWDTNICICWLNKEKRIFGKAKEVGTANLATTIISLAELKFGAYNSTKVKKNLKNIDNMTSVVKVLPFNKEASDHFGKIKADLRKTGEIIEDMDILIASIALAYDGILVTNNLEHFERIDGLGVENWLED